MIRLTTPTLSATDPTARARWAVGNALGILHPSAVPLRDGRVRLTTPDDMLAARVMRAIEELLDRRAADRAGDDRLLAEAVSVIGTEVARARGELPARGAVDALDRYLRVPGLDQSRRTEADAMLRVALSGAAPDDPEAAARLSRLTTPQNAVATSALVSASAAINRDAELLGLGTPPAPRRAGRHRAQVGTRHRRAEGRRVWTSQIRGTGLTVGSRPSSQGQLTDLHALNLLAAMDRQALDAAVTDRPAVDPDARQALLQMTGSAVPQQFRVEIGDTTLGALGQGIIRAGTANEPHVLRIPPGLSDEQVRYVWTHQLTLMSQEIAAAEAGRLRGVLGKLKSVFGHERRDRRLHADHAAFQSLLVDWHEARAETLANGHPSGPRSVPELERDLEGLARTIRRHGGSEPALPWTAGAVATPEATAAGRAAARAEAEAKPARNTPAHLRVQVVTQIETLRAAVEDLDSKASNKRNSSRDASKEARKSDKDAGAEDRQRDRGAPERARKLRVAAQTARNKAGRHTEIAGAYEQAAADARQALAGYQTLLTEIDADGSQSGIADLAAAAKQQVAVYERSLGQAMPAKELLGTGVPEGDQLELPVADINRVLAANKFSEQLSNRGPLPDPAAQYRRLMSRDGMVFSVGEDADTAVSSLRQVRLRLIPDDLTERDDIDFTMAEQMSGSLGEGGTSVGTTDTHSTNVNIGVNIGAFLALAAPGTPVHAAAQLVSPKVEVARGRSLAENSGATAHHQSGWVDDNRGESILYEWSGKWQIEVRASPTEPWSAVETVDAGRQQTWVSSAYTVKPPAETVSLAEIGHGQEVTGEFPRHAVTSITGLHDVTDRLVRKAQQKYDDLDRVSYNHIAGMMINDSHRLLREFSQPGGVTRRIPTGGETEYDLTWEVEPIWADAQLVGESSSEMWQEEVLVDFAGVNASQTYTASVTGTGSVSFPGKPSDLSPVPAAAALNNVGGSGVNVSPNASAGRNVSRSGGQSLSMTTITPAVHRNQGPTQGVLVGLRVRATLRKVGDPKAAPIVETGECRALLRAAENDLLRAGGRADKDAVLREDDGTIKVDKNGHVLLRGDAVPSTVPQKLPPWMGRGENQLRGVGKALPQNLKGAEQAQRQALEQLAKMGLVARPGEPATAQQEANRERIEQQISAPRIEAGINQACQGGLVVMLEDTGFAGTPRWRPFRLSVTQDYDEATKEFKTTGAGTSTNENVVLLGISSAATGRTSSRSRGVPLSAGVGGSNPPPEGVRGWMGKIGLKFSRNALGRTFSYTAGRRVNNVTLSESTEPLDRLKQDVRITFAEMTDRGDAKPIANVRGSMEVAYDSSMTRADAPVYEKNPKAPHHLAVEQAFPVAVDAGYIDADGRRHDPADELSAAIPAIRSDSTALPALHEALSPTSLVANREWMNGRYRLPFLVVRAPGSPAHALADGTILPQEYEIVIRGEAVSLTHVAMSQENSVDINFTMTDVGSTSGTSASGGVSGEAGGGLVEADGSARSGNLSVGRIGGRSQSTTTSETSGDERLLVNPGTHHEFIERHKMTADIMHNGQVIKSVPLPDALAQKAMAERRALDLYASGKLDLPLWVASDAAERYLNDRLPISHRVAAGFLRRYQREKAGVTTGLAAEHTVESLTAKLRANSRAPRAQASNATTEFDTTADQVEEMAAQHRVMSTSEAYDESQGAAKIESLTVEGTTHRVDLRTLVEPQVDELAPGLRDASRLLQGALDVDLKPGNFHGHLEDMLGADGFEVPIEVPIQGQERPDVLFVQVHARYEGERTIEGVPTTPEGEPDIPKEEAGSVDQNYDYEQLDRSAAHTVTVSAGVEGKTPTALGDGSGGVATDQTTSHTGGDGVQNAAIDRLGHFDPVKTHQKIVFTTQVVRVRNAGAAAMASARWKLGRIDPADVTSVSEPRELRADIVQWIPRGDLTDGPRIEPQPELEERAEHRPIRLPEGAVPIRAALHAKGAARRNELAEKLTAHLEQPGVLGRRGTAEYRHLIRSNLKPSALKAKAGRLLGEGIALQPMAKPGNGRTMVSVQINATALGWELHGPSLEGQAGRVWRRQEVYRSSSSSNRLTPVTASGGVDGGFVSVGGSIGEQVKEQSSDANGTRLETSRFLEGQMVTVRIPVVYDATVRTTTDNGHGEPVVKKSTNLPDLARGEMFVRMLRHQYLEGLRQMETGASLDAVLANARLQAVPEELGPPDITATEYGKGKSGAVFQPYRPLLNALDRAKAERKPIVLLVQEADGTERKYQALPNGTMLGDRDGGFASAFATLHPNLALMAEGRVDLRELYNTSSPDGSFSAKVAGALEKANVPRDVLKALDYTTAARTLPHASNQGARTSPGGAAGRTIAQTGHGPSLSGP
ncbi:hypothetical protein EV649_5220 [Kribbella sp. VKM Ac-2569]|uniref:hypothetical protein n=1 Tax=Kribbella sp. VKM Ac-2569 TaxID=2512220 RepID=UPI00102CCA20|nr:hypothetical protein [Kribbella sp. VKM Ac-2569]RZT17663.1 hypothetical protein EV649_5220 [Kribbella sp. VKM Ac-2569]